MESRRSMHVAAATTISSSTKLASVVSSCVRKQLSSIRDRRRRSRRENASFAGTASIPEHPLSPQRPASKTFCGRSTFCSTVSSTPSTFSRGDSSRSSTCSSSSSFSSSSSSVMRSPLPQNLRVQGWMYWARREAHGECYTKVFAVLRNEFLLLYPNDFKRVYTSVEHCAATPLVQIAVAKTGRSLSGVFSIFDPHGDELKLHLYDRDDLDIASRWQAALEQAAELTESHFVTFDIKVDELARDSMYRGSLHDHLSGQKPSLRQNVKQKLTKLASFRRSRSSSPASSSSSPTSSSSSYSSSSDFDREVEV